MESRKTILMNLFAEKKWRHRKTGLVDGLLLPPSSLNKYSTPCCNYSPLSPKYLAETF